MGGLRSIIQTLVLQNQSFIQHIPGFRGWISRFLRSLNPIEISDVQFNTKYTNGFSRSSEKHSPEFKKIMNRLENYIGAGSIGPNKHWEYPWVLANLRLDEGLSILDAGCGKSPLQFLLADLNCRVVGIDSHEDVEWHGIDHRLAKSFGCSIEYVREVIESMSFENNTFDRVCCISVIEHCRAESPENENLTPQCQEDRELQKKIMYEMLRVLKPGGLLVVTVDFNLPRDNCLLESNVDVASLMNQEGAELFGERGPDLFPGEEGFDYYRLIKDSDIDIVNYYDILQTSIGFVLQKKVINNGFTKNLHHDQKKTRI